MEERNYSVYKHTSPSNKVYIGITKHRPERRWCSGKGYKNNQYFYRAIEKYGWDAFKHEILFEKLSKEDACKKEIELIAFYKSNQKEFGYNITSGGDGCNGLKHTEETKKKMSESRKGKVTWNKDLKGFYHHSEATRKKYLKLIKVECFPKNGKRNYLTRKKIDV